MEDWALQLHCLQTIFVSEEHMAEKLVPVLQGVQESWRLPEDRLLLTTAQTYVVAAMSNLKWKQAVLPWAQPTPSYKKFNER